MANELKRVLYLEDDPSIAELAMMGLEDLGGLEVCHCERGADAVAAVRAFRPQLLLFDVMLPDMDGPQTLRQVRLLPEGQDVPVIFMTAKAQIHQQKFYLDLGALGVVVKPFDPVTLADRLRAIFAG